MKVVIYGAGSIGCYIGAILHHESINVHLLGRKRIKDKIAQAGGIFISDYEGRNDTITNVSFACEPSVLQDADIVLVTLKCTAIDSAISELNAHCSQQALIVCLQNGVGAAEQVRASLPNHQVVTGIVPFNVVQHGAKFHRATEGNLHFPIASPLLKLQSAFQSYGLGCELNQNIEHIVWGKLLLNLNNAINALSDIPLKEQLSQRGYRLVLAACQRELLTLCKSDKIHLAKLTAIAPDWLPVILSLPDWLFTRIAQKMLAIDPQARSSMWEDLNEGRQTEIDFLNGAVVTLAQKLGLQAPVNQMISKMIKDRQAGSSTKPVSSNALLAAMKESRHV